MCRSWRWPARSCRRPNTGNSIVDDAARCSGGCERHGRARAGPVAHRPLAIQSGQRVARARGARLLRRGTRTCRSCTRGTSRTGAACRSLRRTRPAACRFPLSRATSSLPRRCRRPHKRNRRRGSTGNPRHRAPPRTCRIRPCRCCSTRSRTATSRRTACRWRSVRRAHDTPPGRLLPSASLQAVLAAALAHASTLDGVHPVPVAASTFIKLAAVRLPQAATSPHVTSSK